MPDTWFELSPWEVGFLAGAHESERSLLDELSTAGHWLGPEYQKAGAVLLAERKAAMEVDPGPDLWEPLIMAARLLVIAERGSAVVVRSGDEREYIVITAVAGELASQLVVTPTGCALRPIPWPLSSAALATELEQACPGGMTDARSTVWVSDVGLSSVAWRENNAEGRSTDLSFRSLCAHAMFEVEP